MATRKELCTKCDKKNHFASVCRFKPKKDSVDRNTVEEESGSIFHKMCNVSYIHDRSRKSDRRTVILDHHIFNDKQGLITRRSAPQHTVTLSALVNAGDYEDLGFHLNVQPRRATIAMA